MEFVSFADTVGFDTLGQQCAEMIRSGSWQWPGCYSSIRPVGILVWHAVPYVLGSDATEVRYITLFMSLMMAAVLCWALLAVLRGQPGYAQCRPSMRATAEALLVVGVLACLTPFVPVKLSDHQSLAVFVAAYAVLAARNFQPGIGASVLAGLLAGCAVLLKQNYVVAAAALLVLWASGLQGPRPSVRQLLAFLAGFSVIGIQFWLTYLASGTPWLYEPGALEPYAASNRQPSVELTAYTDPQPSAYLSSLDRPVSEFKYFAAKFFHGVSVFHWSVYLGKAPLEELPQLLVYERADFLHFRLVFVACVVAASACLLLRSRTLTLLVWTAMASTCFGAWNGHTEFRYFLFFRITAWLYTVVLVCQLAALWPRLSSLLRRP